MYILNDQDLTNSEFVGFAGMVTAVAAYSIWGTDVFPEQDPTGGMWAIKSAGH